MLSRLCGGMTFKNMAVGARLKWDASYTEELVEKICKKNRAFRFL